jgi:hypothetical protein
MTEDQAFEAWKGGRKVTPRPPRARVGEEAFIYSMSRDQPKWYEPDNKKPPIQVTILWCQVTREDREVGRDKDVYTPSNLMFC